MRRVSFQAWCGAVAGCKLLWCSSDVHLIHQLSRRTTFVYLSVRHRAVASMWDGLLPESLRVKGWNFHSSTVWQNRIAISGAARGGGETPPPPPSLMVHLRSRLSSAAIFHCQPSMKINNIHAWNGPCRVCKGPISVLKGPSKAQNGPLERKPG